MIVERTWEGYPPRTYEYTSEEEATRALVEFLEVNLVDPFYAPHTASYALARGGMFTTRYGDVEIRRVA